MLSGGFLILFSLRIRCLLPSFRLDELPLLPCSRRRARRRVHFSSSPTFTVRSWCPRNRQQCQCVCLSVIMHALLFMSLITVILLVDAQIVLRVTRAHTFHWSVFFGSDPIAFQNHPVFRRNKMPQAHFKHLLLQRWNHDFLEQMWFLPVRGGVWRPQTGPQGLWQVWESSKALGTLHCHNSDESTSLYSDFQKVLKWYQ